MDRRLYLHLQGGRELSGVLRGFDMFLNLVMDNAFEELGGGVRKPCGMVVSRPVFLGFFVFFPVVPLGYPVLVLMVLVV